MAYPVSQLLQTYLEQADSSDMLSLLNQLATISSVDFTAHEKASMAADLKAMLSEAAAREQVRQSYLNRLTDREVEIMLLMAAGHSYQASAQQLGISTRTLRQHLDNIKHKLGVRAAPGEQRSSTRQLVALVFALDTMQGIG
jgi:DNA-binding CsgD family transcriptional regulator